MAGNVLKYPQIEVYISTFIRMSSSESFTAMGAYFVKEIKLNTKSLKLIKYFFLQGEDVAMTIVHDNDGNKKIETLNDKNAIIQKLKVSIFILKYFYFEQFNCLIIIFFLPVPGIAEQRWRNL